MTPSTPAPVFAREHLGDELAAEWAALHAAIGGRVFQSPGWSLAWRSAYAPDISPAVHTARTSGRLVGLLAAAPMRRALHRRLPLPLRYTGVLGSGSGAADHLGALATEDAVESSLWTQLLRGEGRHPVLLEGVSSRTKMLLEDRPRLRCLASVPAPYLALNPGQPDVGWSAAMRKDTRRMERRLADENVEGVWLDATDPRFSSDLDALCALHALRWSRDGSSGVMDLRKQSFLEELGRRDPSVPVIQVLRRGPEAVAAILCLREPGGWSFYQSGWDPSWARLGVGRVLVARAIRRAAAEGARHFDFLRGAESYKYRFGAQNAHVHTLVSGRGVAATLLRLREQRP
jgi:CelD/BcsL family acetyltransferase involved in cellulose biosynthesis